jgi:hypothetical protein
LDRFFEFAQRIPSEGMQERRVLFLAGEIAFLMEAFKQKIFSLGNGFVTNRNVHS